jgi:hypothetical protein
MRLLILVLFLVLFGSCKVSQIAVIKQNGKFGCINRHGEIVIEPRWDYILCGDKHERVLVERDSLYGFLDREGNTIIEPKYKDGNLFQEGLAAVGNGQQYGFINIEGDTVIPFVYDDIDFGFSQSLANVTKNDSCGYINHLGEIVIPLKYTTCYPFKSNYGTVMTFDYELLLVNRTGKSFTYDEVSDKIELWPSRNSYPGSIQTSTGQGRVNKEGDTIIPPIYAVTGNLSEHRYIVQLGGKWGVYSDKGVKIVDPKFDELWHYSEGYASFRVNGKWGYINKKGKVVIEAIFEEASSFRNGLAYVELNGKAGYINKLGKFVIQPTFEPNSSGTAFK